MKLDGIRGKVFLDRYALKGVKGELLEHTPPQMWKRVARGIAQNEKPKDRKYWEKKFYSVMEDFKFVPGGRILSGAGTKYQVTYFNCFVIPSPKDSREGIVDSLKQLIEIQSRSGGVGLNLSSLRPRGARVKKVNGTSSGPVTWAGLFSYATHDVVQQGGTRRGATMLMLWDWHPDIEEFITVKQDPSKINGANLSVCISDSFMDAVKKDKNWDLVYPDLDDPNYDSKWNGEIDEWRKMNGKVKVYKTVKAKYLWNLICTAAWRSAEPGLHFLERSNKRSNTAYFEKLIATNPSLRAGTRVLTKEGIFPIEELEGKKIVVKNLDGKWANAECFLSGENKELYKITLNNGKEIFATAEHKWPVLLVGGGFGKVATDKLLTGNILPFPKTEDIQFNARTTFSKEEGFMLGWLYGDGWISIRGIKAKVDTLPFPYKNSFMGPTNIRNFSPEPILSINSISSIHHDIHKEDKKAVYSKKKEEWVFGFLFSEEDEALAGRIESQVNKLKRVKSNLRKASGNTYTIQVTSLEFAEKLASLYGVGKKEKGLPSSVWGSGSDFIKGFVDGLISSDGFIARNANRIILTTKHKKIAEDFSDLLSFYGIKNNIRRSESENIKFPNGKKYYRTYERYDVSIDGHNVVQFGKIFKLSHPRKQRNLQRIISEYTSSRKSPDEELIRIKSVEKTNIRENVWDVSVYDDAHCFYISHCITGNCGEQPLGAWAVCNLGAMNLAAYVGNGKFDYKNFGLDLKVALRLLDNVIDQTYYFFKENEKCAKDIRRTGLGIMGLGDALIKMKIRYGSKDSFPIVKKIFQTLRDNAYDASSDIAKEKGSFPKFDKKKYLKGYHIKNLPQKIQQKIAKQGIRNAVLLTIAPTGTTSLVAGVTSGIEPVYEFAFVRRDRIGEHTILHPLFEEWKKQQGKKPFDSAQDRPDYFASANDLTPFEHAKVQAIAQEFIDSSISKTVNAPNSHTIEDVKTLYMAAYDLGLKGVTYMRDGSREGVLTRVESSAKPDQLSLPKKPILPRPIQLEGVTYQIQTPVGKTYITLNHTKEKEPFEVFITIGKSGSDIAAMADALGRMISLNLRLSEGLMARERMRQVVAQLIGIGGTRSVGFGKDKVRSLPDGVAKILSMHYGFSVNGEVEDRKNALPNGQPNGKRDGEPEGVVDVVKMQQLTLAGGGRGVFTESSTGLYDICPECGGGSLAYEEGCRKCYSCGYAEC
ncbi:MAG: hypothetical protein HYT07_03805 [Candidatus Levybacteria bacterium]|nr:hypothetical protein [Candidatus Levybacteria bacterium]